MPRSTPTKSTADYVATRFQPNGAGASRRTDFGTETKLGGQVSAKFDDKFSAVLQVISQHQADNSFKPLVEWANVKYQFSDTVSVRAGRIALPSYLYSESRFVGYSSPWAHAPSEVYSVLAITSNDGLDMTWRKSFGEANNSLQMFYGQSSSKLPGGNVKSKGTWGFNDSVEIGSLLLRAGYTNINLDSPGRFSGAPVRRHKPVRRLRWRRSRSRPSRLLRRRRCRWQKSIGWTA